MPDDTPYALNDNGTPMTLAQARALIREEFHSATAPATSPTPAPPPADPRQAERDAKIAELAAGDAAREARRNLAESARLAFQEREGFSIDTFSDDEVLSVMGVNDKPLTAAEERARTKREQEHEILTNPAAYAAYRHAQAVKAFPQRYWGLAKYQREAEMVALGIDPVTFTPPTRLGG